MSYSADTFVADEQPTTAKWNKLWNNDAAFNDGSGFAAGALGSDHASLVNGVQVQGAYTSSSAYQTSTATIPFDDTIPQDSEGQQVLSMSYTPKSSTNILVIEGQYAGSSSIANQNLMATLFTSQSADCIGIGHNRTTPTADHITSVHAIAVKVAGTTSSITVQMRAGGNGAGTTAINGGGGSRQFGTTPKSHIVIREYKAS